MAVETTMSRCSSEQVISQHEKKGKENTFKAKAQMTHATNILPLDASSTPKTPSSTTILTVDAGLTKRHIAQRTRRAREKQSNTIDHNGKAIVSPNFPLTSTKDTACPVSPNTQTMSILVQNSPTSLNDQTTITPSKGSANSLEDFEPSPTPPKCLTQPSKGQPRPQANADTIPAIPLNLDGKPVIQANSIIKFPTTAARDVGKFCLHQDVDGISTSAIFMRAMALFEIGVKHVQESEKSACSVEGLKAENEQLKAKLEALENNCSELKTKTECDASKVQKLEDQLNTERCTISSLAATIASLHAEKDELSRLLEQSRTKMPMKSSVVEELQQLKVENEELKSKVEGMMNQCSEPKTQTCSDACKVQRPGDQLHVERIQRELGETRNLVFSQTAVIADLRAEKNELCKLLQQSRNEIAAKSSTVGGLQGLKMENEELKLEMEGLTRQCSELKAKTDSATSEVLRFKDQMNTERSKFDRELSEARTEFSSKTQVITELCAEKEKLSRVLEQSRDEIASKITTIRELQSSIKKLDQKVASSMQRESIIKTLRESALAAEQLAEADIKRSRQAGYTDGLIDGRKIGWKEFAELQKREPSQADNSTQSSDATQAGSSS